MISVLSLTVSLGGKYLLRNALERPSQVVVEFGSSFCSQSLALSLSEKGKSRSRIASIDTLLILMVSHFARNLRRCALGLSRGCPPNWPHSIKVMIVGLSLKLLASTVGFKIDDVTPDACDKA